MYWDMYPSATLLSINVIQKKAHVYNSTYVSLLSALQFPYQSTSHGHLFAVTPTSTVGQQDLQPKVVQQDHQPVVGQQDLQHNVVLQDHQPVVVLQDHQPVVVLQDHQPVVALQDLQPNVGLQVHQPVVLLQEQQRNVLLQDNKPVVGQQEKQPSVSQETQTSTYTFKVVNTVQQMEDTVPTTSAYLTHPEPPSSEYNYKLNEKC